MKKSKLLTTAALTVTTASAIQINDSALIEPEGLLNGSDHTGDELIFPDYEFKVTQPSKSTNLPRAVSDLMSTTPESYQTMANVFLKQVINTIEAQIASYGEESVQAFQSSLENTRTALEQLKFSQAQLLSEERQTLADQFAEET